VHFEDADLLKQLVSLTDSELDRLEFGVVRMDHSGLVTFYNSVESTITGLKKEHTLGRNFFEHVAPCTNNYLVAQRFRDEPELDAILPYVFTLRMKPTPVRLRLLRATSCPSMYLLVERSK
jgi:photoactive yellow protein